jgi:hypothetical protein
VVAYDTTEHWREREELIGQDLLDAAEALAAESGEPVEKVRAAILEMNATVETQSRRVFLVAEAG